MTGKRPARGYRVAGIVLAAGRSRRMGRRNKLTENLGGQPLVRRVVRAVLDAGLEPALVVLGHQPGALRRALTGLPVCFIPNPAHRRGLGTSVGAGVAALPRGVCAALLCPADLPGTSPGLIRRLVRACGAGGVPRIARPVHGRRPGNPVLWPRRYFSRLRRLPPASGGRWLIARHAGRVQAVELTDSAGIADLDTPADMDHWRRRLPASPRT